MAAILYKWLMIFMITSSTLGNNAISKHTSHPIFVSVTEIEHRANTSTVEISCKLFTDDFEKALRRTTTSKIDLLNASQKSSMGTFINAYIVKHLQLTADGKKLPLQFIGFEQDEEGIVSYYQCDNVKAFSKLLVFNNLLYEECKQQMGIIHVTVAGRRVSAKLNNPSELANFEF